MLGGIGTNPSLPATRVPRFPRYARAQRIDLKSVLSLERNSHEEATDAYIANRLCPVHPAVFGE